MHPRAVRAALLLFSGLLVGCDPCPCDEAPAVAPAGPAAYDAMLGHWSGAGIQSGGVSWDMELDVTSAGPGRCASVSYPDVGCSGFWTCNPAGDGSLRGVERIVDGRDRCVDIGFMVTINEDGLLEYRAADGEVEAFARLARTP
jgi:hypothetical protein